MILSAYKDRKKLEALAKLCGLDEGFDDRELPLEVRSLQRLLKQALEAGEEVTEEDVLDGVYKLGKAFMYMDE